MSDELPATTPPPERPGLLAELPRRGVTRAVVAYAVGAVPARQGAAPVLQAIERQ